MHLMHLHLVTMLPLLVHHGQAPLAVLSEWKPTCPGMKEEKGILLIPAKGPLEAS